MDARRVFVHRTWTGTSKLILVAWVCVELVMWVASFREGINHRSGRLTSVMKTIHSETAFHITNSNILRWGVEGGSGLL